MNTAIAMSDPIIMSIYFEEYHVGGTKDQIFRRIISRKDFLKAIIRPILLELEQPIPVVGSFSNIIKEKITEIWSTPLFDDSVEWTYERTLSSISQSFRIGAEIIKTEIIDKTYGGSVVDGGKALVGYLGDMPCLNLGFDIRTTNQLITAINELAEKIFSDILTGSITSQPGWQTFDNYTQTFITEFVRGFKSVETQVSLFKLLTELPESN